MQPPRNLSIDTLRMLAAFEVVTLHVRYDNLPGLAAVAIRLQARWAVPFFFIISGYFLGRRLADPGRADMRPSIYRLIWIFALWSLIYVPQVIAEHGPKEVLRRLLFPSVVYIGEYFHLWFPSSLAFGMIILLFVFYYRLEKWLPIISLAIIVHVLLAGAYNRVFDLKFPFDFVIARHWTSIPALALGVWLFRRGPLHRWAALALAGGGLGLQIVESWYLQAHFGIPAYDHEFLIGTLPFALGMASLAVSGLRLLEVPAPAHWGQDYSLGIYLVHILVIFLIARTIQFAWPVLEQLALWDVLQPFVVVLACLGLLAAIRRWLPGFFRFLLGDHIARAN
ncbi:MAG: acyltransferase family protein [Bacteroidota bacterium]